MSGWEIATIILTTILGFCVFVVAPPIAKSFAKLHGSNVQLDLDKSALKAEIEILLAKLDAYRGMSNISRMFLQKPINKINKKTTDLIALAARSSNLNEAQNAALEACKRLHKELNS